MCKARILFIGICMIVAGMVRGQGPCTTLGQTPATAFPVCGSSVFTQASVPPCVNGSVYAPCSTSDGLVYEDLNPYFYKFTCFAAGTLQMTIKPKDNGDDYDWQLFDVTGHSPSDIYTNRSLLVACNWSGLTGTTGTDTLARSLTECGSTGTNNPPIFSKEPSLQKGHDYLLLISHFSGDSQSGYDLSFNGGTAVITDTVTPGIKKIVPTCDGSRILVVLNKKMKCSSLESGGSDFVMSGTPVQPVSAKGNGCSTGFDMDSIVLIMASSIPPGNYTISTQKGKDRNTLDDYCDNELAAGLTFPFHLAIPTPIAPDSLTKPGCAPNVLTLVFPKAIECNTIAADGSDFTVTGSSVVTVIGASGVCDEYGETYSINVQLSAPIVMGGNYVLHLQKGIDNNTLIDECGLDVLEGPGLSFSTKDTVSAEAWTEQTYWGCLKDSIVLGYPNINGVDQWSWIFGAGDTSHLQNPSRTETVFNTKTIQLIVSNGFCSDTTSFPVVLDNAIQAAIEVPDIMCPKDPAEYRNLSTGKLSSWDWDLGDGTTEATENPAAHAYAQTGIETIYTVRLIIGNAIGCYDTAYGKIKVLRSCYIAVPSAFTPNGDGLNDYLYPLNAYMADHMAFRVFNRWGQEVYFSSNWLQKWDGTIGGRPAASGTYVWSLQYTDRETGKKVAMKGTTILIR